MSNPGRRRVVREKRGDVDTYTIQVYIKTGKNGRKRERTTPGAAHATDQQNKNRAGMNKNFLQHDAQPTTTSDALLLLLLLLSFFSFAFDFCFVM